jgi:hypothetical protein
MCNIIKGVREYASFVAFFAEFLRSHGDEYRAADPDDGKSVRAMRRKFDAWLARAAGCERDRRGMSGRARASAR